MTEKHSRPEITDEEHQDLKNLVDRLVGMPEEKRSQFLKACKAHGHYTPRVISLAVSDCQVIEKYAD